MSLSLLDRQYYLISKYFPCICCALLTSSETKKYISLIQENDQAKSCNQLTVIQHIHSFSFITKSKSARFQKFSTNYSEKHVPGSQLFFWRFKSIPIGLSWTAFLKMQSVVITITISSFLCLCIQDLRKWNNTVM